MQVGLLLGKTGLQSSRGLFQYDVLFPGNSYFLNLLARIGFIFYIFLVGVKMDPGMIWNTGRKGISIGLAVSILPQIVWRILSDNLSTYIPGYRVPAISAITRIQCMTPFPVIASVLIDLKIMNTELGQLALASTLVSDMTSTATTVIINAYNIQLATAGQASGVQSLVLSIFMVLFVVFSTRPLFFKIIRRTQEGKSVKGIYIAFICWGVLLSAIMGDLSGLPYFYLPFVIGLAVPNGPPLGSTLVHKLETLSSGLLAPLMVTLSTLRASVQDFTDFSFLTTVCYVIIGSSVVKFVSVVGPALINHVPLRDSVTLAIIMCAQGVVQAAYYDTIWKNDVRTYSF